MNELPSKLVVDIPEIIYMIIGYLDEPTLRKTTLVCKAWSRHSTLSLWRQLIIPKDWYSHDLSPLWPGLDRNGHLVKALWLQLSPATRMAQDFDLAQIVNQLTNLLSRMPNLQRLQIHVPREIKSTLLSTVAIHAKNLKQFDTDLLEWDPADVTVLLKGCPALTQIAGHNFAGNILQAIAQTPPQQLCKIDCTHPRFDDEELVEFASHFQLSVSLHQFLTAKALMGVAQYCHKLEHINFHFCLSLQSNGFRALLDVSPNLRVLDLGLTEVLDCDIALVAAQCPKLETLKLPFCSHITEASIRAIVSSCSQLLHLDVSFCDKVLLSIFDANTTWACEGLDHLDISGIHGSYAVDVTRACTLLPAMYRQLGRLTLLRYLKLSGHGFSLQMLEVGRSELSKLKKLKTLEISKLRKPLPWKDLVEIGNLFPRLTEFQFRSSDVIPPEPDEEEPDEKEPKQEREEFTTKDIPKAEKALEDAVSEPTKKKEPPAKALPTEDIPMVEVMKATLFSGLEISFRLNGEDEEGDEASVPSHSETMTSKEWILDEESELRLEIDFDTKVKLRLVTGTAEIFGTELGQSIDYEFSGRKIAVFTWHGCKLQIQGTCSVEYIANETPMISYLNTHLALEQRRVMTSQNNGQGPRVLIVGPNDVGKTSLSKLLLSYALKQSRQPIYVDLDCSEGSITMPGCLTATPLTEMIDVEEGFGSSATSAPTAGSAVMPLAYYYGFPSPKDNVKLYNLLVSRLAQSVNRRLEEDEAARKSGIIIDTNGLIDATGYQVIAHCIKAFSVDVIVALGHERLYSDMVRLHQKSGIAVVKLAKSGGVVERDSAFRRQTQNQKIREYFYGTTKSELAPYSTMINYHDVDILRVGEGSLAPSSALPIGEDRKVSETHVVKVEPGEHLLHSVLAVSNADKMAEPEILETNLAGFIYVSEVHEGRKKMTVLSPCPGRIPKKFWWQGSLKWAED
ncbi:Cleavage polyadenylation factor subunit clp1 [Podila clonocystis]|nr:Cleavage polyadenylation factor subunit clp1 [Podila clonocystis]